MTILYVHFPSDMYGAGRSLIRLCGELKVRGHAVHVLLTREGPLRAALETAGATVHFQSSMGVIERSGMSGFGLVGLGLRAVLASFRTAQLIRSLKPDIVHTNTGIIFTGALGARIAGVPHVWHIRDWFGEFPGLWKWYSKLILRTSSRVLCVSRAIALQFPEDPKVRVVNNGFDLAEFEVDHEALRESFRTTFGLGQDLVIGTVGRIKLLRKGQEVFVRAAALLEKRGVHARYLIVGSTYPGNEAHMEQLQDLVRDLGLSRNVVFTGELADPRPAYAAMDVFVLPSAQPEPFGGVVMEAMAMSRPVIATDLGGSPEQVVHGSTGLLIPPNDVSALADALEVFCRDATFRHSCGAAGRERVAAQFRLGDMVERIITEYDAVRRKP